MFAARLREGAEATRTVFFQHQGAVRSQREVTDFGERRQYLELAAKLRGRHVETPEAPLNEMQMQCKCNAIASACAP